MPAENYGILTEAGNEQFAARTKLGGMARCSDVPDHELPNHLGLYIERMTLSRIFLMHKLYLSTLNVAGSIVEFGVRWGQNAALFNSMRGMYEPYNHTRKYIGFDTFAGFPSTDGEKDPKFLQTGNFSVSQSWKAQLEEILSCHDTFSALPHLKKWELVAGDATITFPQYLDSHPEMIISLAYFDFDIYLPTKNCLELVLSRLTKGSIVAFDELNHPNYPGETIAVQEVLGSKNIRLQRDPHNSSVCWFVWE